MSQPYYGDLEGRAGCPQDQPCLWALRCLISSSESLCMDSNSHQATWGQVVQRRPGHDPSRTEHHLPCLSTLPSDCPHRGPRLTSITRLAGRQTQSSNQGLPTGWWVCEQSASCPRPASPLLTAATAPAQQPQGQPARPRAVPDKQQHKPWAPSMRDGLGRPQPSPPWSPFVPDILAEPTSRCRLDAPSFPISNKGSQGHLAVFSTGPFLGLFNSSTNLRLK